MVEKIPEKEFSEPQVTKATRNMEVFTGIIPQKKKVETKGFISEREEHPLKMYMNAASKTLERQRNDLNSNSAHTQSFTKKDTCREGYHGYNMVDGHDKRARTLVDTNRTYYKNYIVPLKGIDEDGQVPHVAEKTQKKEVQKFTRYLAVGEGGYNETLIQKSAPTLSSAKLVVEGRTGGSSLNVNTQNVKPLKHRVLKKEDDKFSSEHGQINFDHETVIVPEMVPSSKNILPQNKLRQKVFDSGTVIIPKKISAMNTRDAMFVEGINAPSLEECNIRSEKERNPSQEDPELETILIQQTLDECRINSDFIMSMDNTIENTDTYGVHGPEKMVQHSESMPSHRMPEVSVENNVVDPIYGADPVCERPKQVLGTTDAVNNKTLLVESNFRQSRVSGPKERRLINKTTKNRDATINESNVVSANIRSEKRVVNSQGAQNIHSFQDGRRFHEFQKTDTSNVVVGSSDDVEPSRMGFIKGFMQTINQILPGRQEKEQLTSGLEQIKFPTGHLTNGSLPMLSGEEMLKEETIPQERMANRYVPVHMNPTNNVVKCNVKRGILNIDRLTSLANGKREVARDAWVPFSSSVQKSKEEFYRPPSAMSETGSLCIPNFESEKDSKPETKIRC